MQAITKRQKLLTICLILAMVLTLPACGSSGSPSSSADPTSADYAAGYQAGYQAALDEMGASPAPTGSQAAGTPEPAGTEAPAATSDLGTRKNPANIGDTVTLTVESFSSGTGTVELTLEEVVSGDEAWQMIQAANQFNEAPGDGKEYILAKFKATFVKDTSGADTPLDTSDADFKYATTDYSVESVPFAVWPDPQFNLTLYEGASGEGWVGFLVSPDEAAPHAVYIDTAWFNLK